MQAFDWKWFLLSFDGRITRSAYWLKFVLPYLVIAVVLGILDAILGMQAEGVGLLGGLFGLAAIWPSIAVGAKRCHDRGRSGWFQLILLIPVVGVIWLLVEVGFLRGTMGENRFGPDPLDGVA